MNDELEKHARSVLVEDAPRIIRKDMTALGEMLAKYTAMSAGVEEFNPELSEQLQSVSGMLAEVRQRLGYASSSAAGVQLDAGRQGVDVHEERLAPTPKVPSGTLLSMAMVKLGLVSSSGRAKLGMKHGVVKIDDNAVTADKPLDPGRYKITSGEIEGFFEVE